MLSFVFKHLCHAIIITITFMIRFIVLSVFCLFPFQYSTLFRNFLLRSRNVRSHLFKPAMAFPSSSRLAFPVVFSPHCSKFSFQFQTNLQLKSHFHWQSAGNGARNGAGNESFQFQSNQTNQNETNLIKRTITSQKRRSEHHHEYEQSEQVDKMIKSIQQTSSQHKNQYGHRHAGITGGQLWARLIKEHDVEVVFGYPGGAILPAFDGAFQEKLNIILPRHEQGAGHMAEGYARATGKTGVVMVTSGPGATNTITAMQDALSDGTPMVVFTGQVATSAIGSDAFQEADVLGISRHCTKWNTMVRHVGDLPKAVRQAFAIATSGRPGPVLVDLPKDVTSAIFHEETKNEEDIMPSTYRQRMESDSKQKRQIEAVEAAAKLLNNAKRPLLYVGQGAMDYSDLVRQLAIKANVPVTTTLMGLGIFDEMHPLALHMLGMHGSAYANLAIQNADVIIAIGARFDDRVTGNLKKFAPAARQAALEGQGGIVHLEIASKQINKVVPVEIAIDGDCGQSMRYLIPHVHHRERKEWLTQISQWKERYPFYYKREPDRKLKPQAVLEEIDRQLTDRKHNVLFTTGVGQHQMWAAQFIRWRHPRSWITSGGLGTMGFGLPAAIGAQVACPDKIVIDVDGDASLSMTVMELQTAAEFQIPVKVLLLNNDFQGMVKQWQDLFYDKRYASTRMKNPNFAKLAEAMGATGLRVERYEDLPSVISEFLACKGPVLLDAIVEKDEHVYPMVPAGRGLDDMVMHSALQ